MASPRCTYVSADTLREIFNAGGYWELAKQGKLHEKVYSEGLPQKSSQEPPGTLSQIVAYLDAQGRQVAIVHQYLRKDGSLGASGKPDPKKLFHEGTLYIVGA
jgi:hypothetical protein